MRHLNSDDQEPRKSKLWQNIALGILALAVLGIVAYSFFG